MPYAPTVNDVSGQIFAQGLSGGVDAIVQGMQQKAAERRQKEEEKQLAATLGPVIEQLSGGAIKLEDAPRESWPILFQAAQAEQQRPLRELQQRNAELENVIRSMEISRAPGRAASEDEAARLNNELLALQVQDAKTPRAAFRPDLVDMGGGRFAMTTSDKSAVPYDMTPGRESSSPLGQLLTDLSRAEARGDTRGAEILLQGARTTASGGATEQLDEVTLLQWQGLEQQKARLLQEIKDHQAAIAGGDKRTGFLNISSRTSAVEEATRALRDIEMQQRLLLARPGGRSAAAPAAGDESTDDSSGRPATGSRPATIDPDAFFRDL